MATWACSLGLVVSRGLCTVVFYDALNRMKKSLQLHMTGALLVASAATGRRRSGRLCHFSMSLTNRYRSIGMYISGFLVPVRADKKAEYQDIAERFREIAKDYGALEQVEAWEVDIKDGKRMVFGGFEPLVVRGR